jgi:hypothetical protein
MSREVEVNNIQMTATVPEDLQISLGHLQYVAGGTTDVTEATAKNFTGLAGNQGILTAASGDSADDGNVKVPNTGTDAISMLDWSSSADISEYYRLGKIIPASSIDGQNIYFTPDAAGVGKTLKTGANFYQAANITSAFKLNAAGTAYASDGTGESAKTTLHAINNTTRASDKWNDGTTNAAGGNSYETAEGWNETNDDGYYVDIPIWLRSSAKEDIDLAVDAYVTTNATVDEDDLYLAARAVILYAATPGISATPDSTTNLLRVRQDTLEGDSIVNYMYTTKSTGDCVNGTDGTYANAVEYDGSGILTVAAGENNSYGDPTKAIIRVWLEGEDPNCWNQNAGQNFNISLRFYKDDLSEDGLDTYPDTAIDRTDGSGYAASGNLVQAGDTLYIDTTSGETTNHLVFTYNGTNWKLTDGSFFYDPDLTYEYNSEEFTNTDELAAILDDMDITKATATASATTAIEIEGSDS